jgi:hypothetical protein
MKKESSTEPKPRAKPKQLKGTSIIRVEHCMPQDVKLNDEVGLAIAKILAMEYVKNANRDNLCTSEHGESLS